MAFQHPWLPYLYARGSSRALTDCLSLFFAEEPYVSYRLVAYHSLVQDLAMMSFTDGTVLRHSPPAGQVIYKSLLQILLHVARGFHFYIFQIAISANSCTLNLLVPRLSFDDHAVDQCMLRGLDAGSCQGCCTEYCRRMLRRWIRQPMHGIRRGLSVYQYETASIMPYSDLFPVHDGGSYFQNISSPDDFSFSSEFEGCQADAFANNLLVDPNGDQYLCTDTDLFPDDTTETSTCPLEKQQMWSGDW